VRKHLLFVASEKICSSSLFNNIVHVNLFIVVVLAAM
jgi:hypothetical protein